MFVFFPKTIKRGLVHNGLMKKKIILTLTFAFLFLSAFFAMGSSNNLTGFVVSDASQVAPVNQLFSIIFVFLALAIFIVGLLHD